jgi:hypothetical protein
MGSDHIVFELEAEPLAQGDCLRGYMLSRREIRKQEKHRKSIVEISQRVDKSGIPLLDDMIELDLRNVCLL